MALAGEFERTVVDAELKEVEMEVVVVVVVRCVGDGGKSVKTRGCEVKCSIENHTSCRLRCDWVFDFGGFKRMKS